ncbi:tRNA (5-methylaminomethyl-2-thiouridylate)-methyltransferase [Acidihalobacter ferrooxydans]|uniref:tRNA (5-methylaminomethyl-2-thiouridylate)-methyltransferase n=1 Tax=Acidihalobacter ferrooxydans TaxID=1765967 RepID=A0A1P8UDP4_9GAMM|nr:tRNA (5-methylaminomethyl-2-thiouridylate)-methyltransferase [Acidihalobacter ferrooxydans]APZ41918.1 tRNA (5-methylaminomethyl-2-thiouridylate)-methyltransferase [Acidihalobacter ferrooxydans]
MTQRKAVALISGGLDSMLAARAVMAQGVHVEGINFFTGFCVEGHTHAIRKQSRARPKRNNALWVAEQLGIRLHIVDVVEAYKDVVLNPRHGYGANLNPCLDCKVFMVGKAREWMEDNGFDFIITGEVIGQRPKSQLKKTLPIVARESGADDRLLRPLCARNLAPTLPEREGWVDRAQLFDFSGRSRKPQMALAERFGLEDYAQPAGGCCFLTDESYSRKLADLWLHRGEKRYELDDIMLLKIGRHLRPRAHFKLIVAREEGESRFLEGYRKQFTHLRVRSHGGPLTLVDSEAELDAEDLLLAARIVARFSQGRDAECVEVEVACRGDAEPRRVRVAPLPPDEVPQGWYV